jgi:integrase
VCPLYADNIGKHKIRIKGAKMKNKRFKTYLYKRNRSKYYQLKIVDTAAGAIKRISTKETSKTDAWQFVRDYRKKYLDNLENNLSQDVIENLPQNNRSESSVSIAELISRYINEYRENKMMRDAVSEEKKAQYRKNDRYATNLLLEYFEDAEVKDITEASINKFIKFCMYQREEKTNGERKNLAYASVNQALTALASILNNVYKKKDKVTILEFLRPIIEQLKDASDIRKTIMTRGQVKKIIEWFEENYPHLAPMIKLLQLSGARRGEIQDIKWNDIEWDERYVRIYDSKQKKGNSFRHIYFDNEIKEDLMKMKLQKGSDYVFVGQISKKRIQTRSLYNVWDRMIKELNLYNHEGEKYRFHDFRRYRITINTENGITNEYTDSQTGHKTNSCRKRYQIENRAKQRQFVDKVSALDKKSEEKEGNLESQTLAILEKILDKENEDVWMTDLYDKAKELKEKLIALRQ